MIDDLTMLANLTVVDSEVAAAVKLVKAEADKAAASETMPPPKRKRTAKAPERGADRVARRAQDPPAAD